MAKCECLWVRPRTLLPVSSAAYHSGAAWGTSHCSAAAGLEGPGLGTAEPWTRPTQPPAPRPGPRLLMQKKLRKKKGQSLRKHFVNITAENIFPSPKPISISDEGNIVQMAFILKYHRSTRSWQWKRTLKSSSPGSPAGLFIRVNRSLDHASGLLKSFQM